jgi:hypothetical protein
MALTDAEPDNADYRDGPDMSHPLTLPNQDSSTERRIVVPYVTAWSAEQELPYEVMEHHGFGIAYADEILTDRDEHGVLWRRTLFRPRHGRPEFGQVHPLRQRRAMRRLLCQVCGDLADRTKDGVLWLLPDHRDDWASWPNGMANVEPPVCLPCVRTSVRLCPALRKGAIAVRVRDASIVGVRGALYKSGGASPVAVAEAIVTFDDPVIRWVRAANLVRKLHGCTIVPLKELADQPTDTCPISTGN